MPGESMPRTYNDLCLSLSRRLRDAGVEAHSQEARWIVAAAAGKGQAELLRDLRLYTSDEVAARAEALAVRRLAGEPAAYVLGRWEFYGLEFVVNPEVLIPRPDTEVLVTEAAARMEGRGDIRFLDMCTGSGCVGCALAKLLPDSRGILLDISPGALAVARENVRRMALSGRLECVRADAFRLPGAGLGSFDLIAANPPYIRTGELAGLDSSVRDYEPRTALDGGVDGLDFYRAILSDLPPLLRPGGWIVLEVGEDQAEEVALLLRRAGLRGIGAAPDSRGYARVVYAKN